MEREKIIKDILELEEKYDVASWKMEGLHVWPLIRSNLFFSNYKKAKPVEDRNQHINWKQLINRLIINSIYTLRFFLRNYNRTKIVFAGADSHRILFKNKLFNRYFDPILDELEESKIDKGYIIEVHGDLDSKEVAYYKKDRVIEAFRVFYILNLLQSKLQAFSRKKAVVTDLESYEDFLYEVRQLGLDTDGITRRSISNKLRTIKLYSKIFKRITSKINSEFCFVLCYYINPMYGLMLAAQETSSKVIDMQHGGQGPLHIAYTTWSSARSENYEFLPNYFWCWDQTSYDNINQWAKSTKHHKALLGGNPWLDYFYSNYSIEVKELPQNLILYTLQPIGEIIDDYIIETIKMTYDKFNWYLRLHPRQLNEKALLVKILKENDVLDKVNIDDATELPLPLLLKNTLIHITKFSGAALEAASLGVPTITIDKLGTETFAELIKKEVVFPYIQNEAGGLLTCIEMLKEFNKNVRPDVPSSKAVLLRLVYDK